MFSITSGQIHFSDGKAVRRVIQFRRDRNRHILHARRRPPFTINFAVPCARYRGQQYPRALTELPRPTGCLAAFVPTARNPEFAAMRGRAPRESIVARRSLLPVIPARRQRSARGCLRLSHPSLVFGQSIVRTAESSRFILTNVFYSTRYRCCISAWLR